MRRSVSCLEERFICDSGEYWEDAEPNSAGLTRGRL
jgi:hypothetical protein